MTDETRCPFVGTIARVRGEDLRRAIADRHVGLQFAATTNRRCVLSAHHLGDHEVETPTGRPLALFNGRRG